MAVPLSWKVGGAVAALLVAALAWHGFSLYMAGRHADELTRDVQRNAELQAQQARAQAQQRSAELAATLQHQRDDLANTYRQVNEDAAEYKVAEARREEQRRQEERQVQATFRLGPNQKCAGGIVINRSGSTFTQAVGKRGQPIHCTGDTADEPLR
jgi:septal ring factor EnvC (AmiA/AmiB activator)